MSRKFNSGVSGDSYDEPLIDPDDASAMAAPSMVHIQMDDVEREEARLAMNTGELYGPLGWTNLPLPLRIIASILFVPLVGLFWVKFAVSERMAKRLVGHNPADWVVILFVGLMHQLAVIGPITVFLSAGGLSIRCYFPTDFYGAMIFYPLSIVYLLGISLIYRLKKQTTRVNTAARRLEGTEVSATRANAIQLLENFRISTAQPLWLLIPFCMALAVLLVLIIRLCLDTELCYGAWTRFDIPLQDLCVDDTPLNRATLKSIPPARISSLGFNLMNLFWWFLTSASSSCCLYAVILFYQQVRQIEEFTYVQRYASKRPFLRDVNDFSKDVAVWATVWQELLQGLNNRPICRAFISTNATVAFLLWVGSAFYIVFQTVLHQTKAGELTTACSALLGFNTLVLIAFLYISIKLQRIIEYQVKSISSAQNDLQRQIDENKKGMARSKMLKMMSNCRVLAALDVYLGVYDNTPKIVGSISLESMRWIGLLGGLAAMNLFFFALYLSRCH